MRTRKFVALAALVAVEFVDPFDAGDETEADESWLMDSVSVAWHAKTNWGAYLRRCLIERLEVRGLAAEGAGRLLLQRLEYAGRRHSAYWAKQFAKPADDAARAAALEAERRKRTEYEEMVRRDHEVRACSSQTQAAKDAEKRLSAAQYEQCRQKALDDIARCQRGTVR